jgi:hypothetical protein
MSYAGRVSLEKLKALRELCPDASLGDCRRALEAEDGDVAAAAERMRRELADAYAAALRVSSAQAEALVATYGWDIERARRSLVDWRAQAAKDEERRARRASAWMATPAESRARELVRVDDSSYQLCDLGLLDEGGALWDVAPALWEKLAPADRVLEWLYTMVLLILTDHAQAYWDLPAERIAEALVAMEQEGFGDVARALRGATETSFKPGDSMRASIEARFHRWIIANAARLSWFANPENMPEE